MITVLDYQLLVWQEYTDRPKQLYKTNQSETAHDAAVCSAGRQ